MKKIKDGLQAKYQGKAKAKDGGKAAKPAANLAPKAKNLPKNLEGFGKVKESKKAGEKKSLPVQKTELKPNKKK